MCTISSLPARSNNNRSSLRCLNCLKTAASSNNTYTRRRVFSKRIRRQGLRSRIKFCWITPWHRQRTPLQHRLSSIPRTRALLRFCNSLWLTRRHARAPPDKSHRALYWIRAGTRRLQKSWIWRIVMWRSSITISIRQPTSRFSHHRLCSNRPGPVIEYQSA